MSKTKNILTQAKHRQIRKKKARSETAGLPIKPADRPGAQGPLSGSSSGRRSLLDLLPTGRDRVVAACAALAVLLVGGWAYGGTLADLMELWLGNQDYSHGLLILPGAAFLLWAKRERLPASKLSPAWWGLALIVAAAAIYLLSARLYLVSLASWSIPIFLAGLCGLIGGGALLRFSLPALLLLYFATQLPWGVEQGLRLPLQRIAALASSWVLNGLGLPALAEANTVVVGDHVLEVAQACSGLRMFYGIGALAMFYVLWCDRAWWQRITILASVLPIAVTANTLRIAATGVLYELVSSEAGQKFSHDIAGYLMIPVAAVMLAGVVWCLDRSFQEVRTVEMGHLAMAGK